LKVPANLAAVEKGSTKMLPVFELPASVGDFREPNDREGGVDDEIMESWKATATAMAVERTATVTMRNRDLLMLRN
jgi:hypothetical protein